MGKGGEWYAIALAQQGGYDLSACRVALEDYVSSTKVRSATTRQKLALTLLALGSEHEFIAATLSDSIGKQGVMSWAWGLQFGLTIRFTIAGIIGIVLAFLIYRKM